MTPEQFSKLREGDIIRNLNGHGFSVLERRGGVVLAQCVQSIPQSLAEHWTLCARLGPPPTSCGKMHEDLIAANGLIIVSIGQTINPFL